MLYSISENIIEKFYIRTFYGLCISSQLIAIRFLCRPENMHKNIFIIIIIIFCCCTGDSRRWGIAFGLESSFCRKYFSLVIETLKWSENFIWSCVHYGQSQLGETSTININHFNGIDLNKTKQNKTWINLLFFVCYAVFFHANQSNAVAVRFSSFLFFFSVRMHHRSRACLWYSC